MNVDYTTSIIEALKENPWVDVNQTLLDTYLEWEKDHPFNAGSGMWASEPWSQVEMPLSEALLKKENYTQINLLIFIISILNMCYFLFRIFR